jgi:acyl-CoA reductase-like NAD-dependent aldehyde dehydrogenase
MNAPFILGSWSISQAIAAGNLAILKGAELTPRCSLAIGLVFKEAGLPDGQSLDAAAITATLIQHP